MNNLQSALRIILLGPPGSGKGTQAKVLSEHFDIGHVSTGDILRRNAQNETELGLKAQQQMEAGELVADSVIFEMLEDLYKAKGGQNLSFILDGFPRSEHQAKALTEFLEGREESRTVVLSMEIDDDELVGRLVGRRSCPKCGKSYHIKASPPKTPGRCDDDDTELVRRADDVEEVIRQRLDTYHSQTKPVADFYRARGSLVRIDASKSMSEVQAEILQAVADALPD